MQSEAEYEFWSKELPGLLFDYDDSTDWFSADEDSPDYWRSYDQLHNLPTGEPF